MRMPGSLELELSRKVPFRPKRLEFEDRCMFSRRFNLVDNGNLGSKPSTWRWPIKQTSDVTVRLVVFAKSLIGYLSWSRQSQKRV
jgi:hypothetical protein